VPTHLKFRHRISLLVLLAAVALLIVISVTLVLGEENKNQLTGIETRYLPLIELDGELKSQFSTISRTLEDAASAGEQSMVEEADRLGAQIRARIAQGAQVIVDNGGDPKALDAAFAAYYSVARQVSSALADGAQFGDLSEKIDAMRQSQRTFALALDTATRPDRAKLAAAFAAARHAQRTSLEVDIIVAVLALVLMVVISSRIIRRTIDALREVSDGVERLASGDFSRTIDVGGDDELSDLARQANRTAERLRQYREQSHTQLVETQRQARAAETANKELEAFSYSVSHDLRAPLRGIDGFSQALVEDERDKLSETGRDYLARIRAGAQRMGELIDDLLRLSRVSRGDFRRDRVDLSTVATSVVAELRRANPDRTIDVRIEPEVTANADARLVRIVLENLLGNAWKFTAKAADARIELGARTENDEVVYFVRDNGAGFDMKYVDRLFGAFQRLHTDKDYPGTGIGLATVQRIVLRHGGRIWVEAAVGQGATFQFTLPAESSSSRPAGA
jgi:signal transduction histidine kinase